MEVTDFRSGRSCVMKGRTFTIDRHDVDLFPIKALLVILGRSHKAIYKWEKEFGWPRAMYTVEDDKTRNRWYSRRQLVAIRILYERHGGLAGKRRGEIHQFIAGVRAVFHRVDIPEKTEGT